MFIYAIRSPYTKESYFRRLRRFFDAIELCNDMEMQERCNAFAYRARTDYNWAFSNILRFLQSQKERVERKEITGGTLRNYVKTIKMFCEVTDIIIPWKKISNYTNAFQHGIENNLQTKEALQHFPNDYMRMPFPLGVQENFEEDANKWYSDYLELMEYRKNPGHGRTKCFRCLLSPDMEESALFVGINKVIARALEDGNSYNTSKKDTNNSCNNNDSSSSTFTRTSIYPCKVLNRYACPYDNKGGKIKADTNIDVYGLFALNNIAFQVELAFSHAYSMSKSNETIYEVDFEAGKVKEIYANYRGEPYSFSTEYPLEEKLCQVKKLSKVPIRNIQDVYNALTNRETLDRLLDQGLDDEEYQRHRDELVNLFMGLKDKIKKEDLIIYEPIFTSNIQKGKCFICQEFANIHCINCSNNNIWLCVDHWKQHNVDKHT